MPYAYEARPLLSEAQAQANLDAANHALKEARRCPELALVLLAAQRRKSAAVRDLTAAQVAASPELTRSLLAYDDFQASHAYSPATL